MIFFRNYHKSRRKDILRLFGRHNDNPERPAVIGQGKLDGQVEPDEALEEEPGGGVPDERVLLRPDGRVPEGVLEEGRYHLQVSQGAGLVTDSSLDISLI